MTETNPDQNHRNAAIDSGEDRIAEGARQMDRNIHAATARLTGGLSPVGLGLVWADWAAHLASSPARQGWLAFSAAQKAAALMQGADGEGPFDDQAASDKRFRNPAWRQPPFAAMAAAHKAAESWWDEATDGLPGMTAQNRRAASFVARQMLDMVSPSNFFWTNPEVLARTRDERGTNLLRGARHLAEDMAQQFTGHQTGEIAGFRVGETVATTPGKIVFRNDLIELIQYAPATPKVHARPLLIVPAWIMKYYILDLSPENSMIGWLVAQGFTVFCISWRNPGPEQRDTGFDDYLDEGIFAALDAVGRAVPDQPVHLAGYCLGGTLAAIAAARLAREGDTRLASLTLMAAQTDFAEPGEIGLFIDASQLALLDDMMWSQGGLEAGQMAGAFQLLKSNDLIWSRMQREYLLGQRGEPNDLMAWNADATRMPYRMHARYLRELYLENRLAQGRFEVDGRPVSLRDIHVPVFAVGTEADHVAPWRSVYKIDHLTDTPVTFALASGGHNGGIVSQPGRKGRRYRLLTASPADPWIPPDEWLERADLRDGSWWVAWAEWLAQGEAPATAPRKPRASLPDAPGDYVHG